MKRKPPNHKIIDNIRRIRRNNNNLWMMLLELAIESKPRRSKKIIRLITENDKEISRWLMQL